MSKKGTSLFLPKNFFTDDRLVRAVRRAKIALAELSTFASGLTYVGGWIKASVNLSYAYIAKIIRE